MHIVKYWCNYLDSYKLAVECLRERIAKKIKQEMSTQEANDDIEQNGFLLH